MQSYTAPSLQTEIVTELAVKIHKQLSSTILFLMAPAFDDTTFQALLCDDDIHGLPAQRPRRLKLCMLRFLQLQNFVQPCCE